MPKFAKLFDVKDDDQVLVTLHYNSEEDNHDLTVTTDMGDIVASVKFSIPDEDMAREKFKEYSLDDAVKFRDNMESALF